MESAIEEINPVQRRVKVSQTADQVNAAFERVYKELKSKVRIKGFRPGKVPVTMIRKFYGAQTRPDVFERIVKDSLFAAIETNELKPVASPVIETQELPEEGKEYSFTALIDIMPEIALGDYKGLSATVEITPFEEKMVETEVAMIRRRHAKARTLEADTKAAAGHMAKISHHAKDGDQEVDALHVHGMEVELGADQLFKDLEKAILGMTQGETKEQRIKLPKDYPDTEFAGKKLDFKITLEELKELDLPTLDDEFAKDLGAESLEKLQDTIRERIKGQLEQDRRHRTEEALLDQILKGNPFEVPPSLVDQVIDSMISEFGWGSDEQRQMALKNEDMRKELRPGAKRRAQNTLILLEVSKQEAIQVSDQDVKDHFAKMYKDAGQEPNDAQLTQLAQSMGGRVREDLLFKKAAQLLIDNAKIAEVPKKK